METRWQNQRGGSLKAFKVRSAVDEDAAAVARVYNLAREDAMPFLPSQSLASVKRHLRALFRNNTTLVAEGSVDGRVIGFVAFDDEFITFLYVEPLLQSRGVGTVLLDRAKAGRQHLNVWTFQRNSGGRRFYERRGFVATEFTDGSGNDKREPEVLYAWQAGQ